MAKTGIKIKRANVGSVEAHNERSKEYLEGLAKAGKEKYFFSELTPNNTSWVNPRYEGKTCQELFEDMKALYREKVGQEPQLQDRIRTNKKTGKEYTVSGWSPIREGCPPIKEDTTIEDFSKVIDWARENGLDIIRIDLHLDEGHVRWDDEEKDKRKGVKAGQEVKVKDIDGIEREVNANNISLNRHAHIVFDWVNHDTGKTIKLDDTKMSELQDIMAEALGMERGKKKEVTGKNHIPHSEYREMKAAENAASMEQRVEELTEEESKLSRSKTAKEETIATIKEFGSKARDRISGKDKREKQALHDQIDALAKENSENASELAQERQKRQEAESALQSTSQQLKTAQRANERLSGALDRAEELQQELNNIRKNLPDVLPCAKAMGLGMDDAITLASGKEVEIASMKSPFTGEDMNCDKINHSTLKGGVWVKWMSSVKDIICKLPGLFVPRGSNRFWVSRKEWAEKFHEWNKTHGTDRRRGMSIK